MRFTAAAIGRAVSVDPTLTDATCAGPVFLDATGFKRFLRISSIFLRRSSGWLCIEGLFLLRRAMSRLICTLTPPKSRAICLLTVCHAKGMAHPFALPRSIKYPHVK